MSTNDSNGTGSNSGSSSTLNVAEFAAQHGLSVDDQHAIEYYLQHVDPTVTWEAADAFLQSQSASGQDWHIAINEANAQHPVSNVYTDTNMTTDVGSHNTTTSGTDSNYDNSYLAWQNNHGESSNSSVSAAEPGFDVHAFAVSHGLSGSDESLIQSYINNVDSHVTTDVANAFLASQGSGWRDAVSNAVDTALHGHGTTNDNHDVNANITVDNVAISQAVIGDASANSIVDHIGSSAAAPLDVHAFAQSHGLNSTDEALIQNYIQTVDSSVTAEQADAFLKAQGSSWQGAVTSAIDSVNHNGGNDHNTTGGSGIHIDSNNGSGILIETDIATNNQHWDVHAFAQSHNLSSSDEVLIQTYIDKIDSHVTLEQADAFLKTHGSEWQSEVNAALNSKEHVRQDDNYVSQEVVGKYGEVGVTAQEKNDIVHYQSLTGASDSDVASYLASKGDTWHTDLKQANTALDFAQSHNLSEDQRNMLVSVMVANPNLTTQQIETVIADPNSHWQSELAVAYTGLNHNLNPEQSQQLAKIYESNVGWTPKDVDAYIQANPDTWTQDLLKAADAVDVAKTHHLNAEQTAALTRSFLRDPNFNEESVSAYIAGHSETWKQDLIAVDMAASNHMDATQSETLVKVMRENSNWTEKDVQGYIEAFPKTWPQALERAGIAAQFSDTHNLTAEQANALTRTLIKDGSVTAKELETYAASHSGKFTDLITDTTADKFVREVKQESLVQEYHLNEPQKIQLEKILDAHPEMKVSDIEAFIKAHPNNWQASMANVTYAIDFSNDKHLTSDQAGALQRLFLNHPEVNKDNLSALYANDKIAFNTLLTKVDLADANHMTDTQVAQVGHLLDKHPDWTAKDVQAVIDANPTTWKALLNQMDSTLSLTEKNKLTDTQATTLQTLMTTNLFISKDSVQALIDKRDGSFEALLSQVTTAQQISHDRNFTPEQTNELIRFMANNPNTTASEVAKYISENPNTWATTLKQADQSAIVGTALKLNDADQAIVSRFLMTSTGSNADGLIDFIQKNPKDWQSKLDILEVEISNKMSNDDIGRIQRLMTEHPEWSSDKIRTYITEHKDTWKSDLNDFDRSLTVSHIVASQNLSEADAANLNLLIRSNPNLTEAFLNNIIKDNKDHWKDVLNSASTASTIANDMHMTDGQTEALVRYLSMHPDMDLKTAKSMLSSIPNNQWGTFLEHADQAIAIAGTLHLTSQEMAIVQFKMTTDLTFDAAKMMDYIKSNPDWANKIVAEAQKSQGPSGGGLTPARENWNYEVGYDDYVKACQNDKSKWVEKDVMVDDGKIRDYEGNVIGSGEPKYEKKLVPLTEEEVLSSYIEKYGSPVDKARGVLGNQFYQNIYEYDGKNGNGSRLVLTTYGANLGDSRATTGDTRDRSVNHSENFFEKMGAIEANSVISGVSYRDLPADQVKYLDNPTYLARQLADEAKALKTTWDSKAGDTALQLAVYLDTLGVTDVSKLYVKDGRIVDTVSGKDLGAFKDGDKFADSAYGDGWTDFHMYKTDSGQIVFGQQWADSSDAGKIKLAIAVVGMCFGVPPVYLAAANAAVDLADGKSLGQVAVGFATSWVGSQITSGLLGGDSVLFQAGSPLSGMSGALNFGDGIAGFAGKFAAGGIGSVSSSVLSGNTDNLMRTFVTGGISTAGNDLLSNIGVQNLGLSGAQASGLSSFIISKALGADTMSALTSAMGSYNSANQPSGEYLKVVGDDGTVSLLDKNGNLMSQTKGDSVTLYGENSAIIGYQVKGADGVISSLDSSGNLFAQTKGDTTTLFGADQQVSGFQVKGADGSSSTLDAAGNLLSQTKGDTTTVYGSDHQVAGFQVKGADGYSSTLDAAGNLLAQTKGDTTTLFGADQQVSGFQVKGADGSSSSLDAAGNLLSQTKGDTTTVYGKDQQVVGFQVKNSDGTVNALDASGHLQTSTKGDTTTVYGKDQQVVGFQVRNADGTVNSLDASGHLETSTKGDTTTLYGKNNEVVGFQVKNSDGTVNSLDASGHLQTSTKGDTIIVYGKDQQVVGYQVKGADGIISNLDASGNLIVQSNGSTTATYGKDGRITGYQVKGDDGIISNLDSSGRILNQSNGNDSVTLFKQNGQVSGYQVKGADGTISNLDSSGRLVAQVNGDTTTIFKANGQVAGYQVKGDDGIISMTDTSGKLLSQSNGDTTTIFKANGQVAGYQVKGADGSISSLDSAGHIQTQIKGNTATLFGQNNQVVGYQIKGTDGVISNLDSAGHVLTQVKGNTTTIFGNNGQVSGYQVKGADGIISNLDSSGNLATQIKGNTVTLFGPNAQVMGFQVKSADGLISNLDANGQITSQIKGNTVTHFGQSGQVSGFEVKGDDGTITKTGADGKLVSQLRGDTVTFYGDNGNIAGYQIKAIDGTVSSTDSTGKLLNQIKGDTTTYFDKNGTISGYLVKGSDGTSNQLDANGNILVKLKGDTATLFGQNGQVIGYQVRGADGVNSVLDPAGHLMNQVKGDTVTYFGPNGETLGFQVKGADGVLRTLDVNGNQVSKVPTHTGGILTTVDSIVGSNSIARGTVNLGQMLLYTAQLFNPLSSEAKQFGRDFERMVMSGMNWLSENVQKGQLAVNDAIAYAWNNPVETLSMIGKPVEGAANFTLNLMAGNFSPVVDAFNTMKNATGHFLYEAVIQPTVTLNNLMGMSPSEFYDNRGSALTNTVFTALNVTGVGDLVNLARAGGSVVLERAGSALSAGADVSAAANHGLRSVGSDLVADNGVARIQSGVVKIGDSVPGANFQGSLADWNPVIMGDGSAIPKVGHYGDPLSGVGKLPDNFGNVGAPTSGIPENWNAYVAGESRIDVAGSSSSLPSRVARIEDAPIVNGEIGEDCGARAIRLNNMLTGQTVEPHIGAYNQADFAKVFGWDSIKNHPTQDGVLATLSQAPEGSTFVIGIRPNDPAGIGHVVNAQIIDGQIVIRDAGLNGKYTSANMEMFTSGQPENYSFYTVNSTVHNPDPFLNMKFSTGSSTPSALAEPVKKFNTLDELLDSLTPSADVSKAHVSDPMGVETQLASSSTARTGANTTDAAAATTLITDVGAVPIPPEVIFGVTDEIKKAVEQISVSSNSLTSLKMIDNGGPVHGLIIDLEGHLKNLMEAKLTNSHQDLVAAYSGIDGFIEKIRTAGNIDPHLSNSALIKSIQSDIATIEAVPPHPQSSIFEKNGGGLVNEVDHIGGSSSSAASFGTSVPMANYIDHSSGVVVRELNTIPDEFGQLISFANDHQGVQVNGSSPGAGGAASVEAISRYEKELASGQFRFVIDQYGNARQLIGVDAVDTFAKAGSGNIIVQRGIGNAEWTVLSSDSDLSRNAIIGRVENFSLKYRRSG